MSTRRDALVKEAVAEVRSFDEGDFKNFITSKIKIIIQEQRRIKEHEANIRKIQQEIRELELSPIPDDVLG